MSTAPRPKPTASSDAVRAMLNRAQQQGKTAASTRAKTPATEKTVNGEGTPAERPTADASGVATPPAPVDTPAAAAPVAATPPTPVDTPTIDAPITEAALPAVEAPAPAPGDGAPSTSVMEGPGIADEPSTVASAISPETTSVPARKTKDSATKGGSSPKRRTSAARPKVAALPGGVELTKKSLNLAPEVLATAEEWLRSRRRADRRANLSWLFETALADLPTDLDELRRLAALLPGEMYTQGRPIQVGARIRPETVERIEDAQFELSTTRTRSLALWHCVSAAIARQLEAEGFIVASPGE